MITRIGMAARRAGSTAAQFQAHWRTEHAAAALHIPTLRGYVQYHAVLDERGRPILPYPGFDACSATTFDDLAAMDAGFASPQYQRDVRADEAVLIDQRTFFLLLCRREPIFDDGSAEGAITLMSFLRVHPLADRARLLELARGRYADAVRASGAIRHEHFVPLPEAHRGRQPAHCELVDSATFADVAAALDFLNGQRADRVDALWAGVVFGRERLLASARVIKERHGEATR